MNIDQLRETMKVIMVENLYTISTMAELSGRSVHLLESIIAGNYKGLSDMENLKLIKSIIVDNESAIILLEKVEQDLSNPNI